MDCVEVRYDRGLIGPIPGVEVEDWSDVQMYVHSVEDYGQLTGWGKWTRLYKAVDEHGDERYYFVGEDAMRSYQTTIDRIGPDVQTYRAESIEDALEQLREDLRSLAHEQPDFARLADEADESWLEHAE